MHKFCFKLITWRSVKSTCTTSGQFHDQILYDIFLCQDSGKLDPLPSQITKISTPLANLPLWQL
jgi:hypothetical protein